MATDSWNIFYRQLKYLSLERSGELTKRQIRKNAIFKDKFQVINRDARHLGEFYHKRIKGLILSNELLDNFSAFSRYLVGLERGSTHH